MSSSVKGLGVPIFTCQPACRRATRCVVIGNRYFFYCYILFIMGAAISEFILQVLRFVDIMFSFMFYHITILDNKHIAIQKQRRSLNDIQFIINGHCHPGLFKCLFAFSLRNVILWAVRIP